MKARLPQGMGGGPQNMNAMLKQAQKMQEDMNAMQAELEMKEYEISAGGGMVKLTITGKKEIKTLKFPLILLTLTISKRLRIYLQPLLMKQSKD